MNVKNGGGGVVFLKRVFFGDVQSVFYVEFNLQSRVSSQGVPPGRSPLLGSPSFTGGHPLKETLMNFFSRKMVNFRKLQLIGHSPPPFS